MTSDNKIMRLEHEVRRAIMQLETDIEVAGKMFIEQLRPHIDSKENLTILSMLALVHIDRLRSVSNFPVRSLTQFLDECTKELNS